MSIFDCTTPLNPGEKLFPVFCLIWVAESSLQDCLYKTQELRRPDGLSVPTNDFLLQRYQNHTQQKLQKINYIK